MFAKPRVIIPVDTRSNDGQSLAELWREFARRAPDGVLGAASLCGILAIVGLAVLPVIYWPLLAPLIVAGAFGGWGIADRALQEVWAESGSRPAPGNTSPARTLRAARMFFAVVAAVAAVAVAVTAFLLLLNDRPGIVR